MTAQSVRVEIERQLANLPDSPGVYLMKDETGTIIYIGKAKSLIKRVRSYFRADRGHTLKTKLLSERVKTIEWITTDSEIEALMLESNLIKKHQPHFNMLLKDDKHFPFLCLTMTEQFPRLIKVRRVQRDGSMYFGPYIPEGDANRTLALIKKLFPLRRCSGPLATNSRPCLHYELNQCSSPCTGRIDPDSYAQIVRDVRLFLDGRMDDLVRLLEQKMLTAANGLNFEEAGRLRDRIKAVKNSFRRQKIIATNTDNRDMIGFARNDQIVVIEQFFIRNGRVLGRKKFVIDQPPETTGRMLRSFLIQAYTDDVLVPPEIVVPQKPDDLELVQELLSERAQHKVTIFVPQRGDKRALLEMVQKNAQLDLLDTLKTQNVTQGPLLLRDTADFLGMDHIPQRIEAFDISNIAGVMAVGSLVVWQNDGFCKKDYRRFKINTVSGSNDVAMMAEIVERRFQRLLFENKDLPDIVLLDGGRAQVNMIEQLLYDLGLSELALVGLAKGRSKKKLPRLDRPDEPEYLVLPHSRNNVKNSNRQAPENVLRFFQRIRDEAHRFAIEYHRSLREKLNFRSILDEIPGIGSTRKRLLFRHFGSLHSIMKASETELAAVKGIDRRTARTLVSFFATMQQEGCQKFCSEPKGSHEDTKAR
ncbi:excinuclease ABC subunit UvrC [bacterium]|nr:excinuclease ABC subunit UvrC [bacterium]